MSHLESWSDDDDASNASSAVGQSLLLLDRPRPARWPDPVLSLFAPLHYEPRYAYPLLVWLHGPGEDQRSLRRVMPRISERNYVAVAPRGLLPSFDDRGQQCAWPLHATGLDWAEEQVLRAIDAARAQYNVLGSRVFLAGVDSGGTMALRLALAHPRLVAGVASLGGPLPGGPTLTRLNELRSLQVLLASGRHSRRYPETEVCRNLRLLHSAGIPTVLRQYPGGDELPEQALADLNRWIMELVTAPSADDSADCAPTS